MKNPYTRSPGYRFGHFDPLTGWFVVQSTYEARPALSDNRFPWAVTCIECRQTIYTSTLSEARSIAVKAADDDLSFENWNWIFTQAKDRAGPDYQNWASYR